MLEKGLNYGIIREIARYESHQGLLAFSCATHQTCGRQKTNSTISSLLLPCLMPITLFLAQKFHSKNEKRIKFKCISFGVIYRAAAAAAAAFADGKSMRSFLRALGFLT